MKAGIQILFFLLPLLSLAQDWQGDFDVALQKSKDEQKPIVLVFSGSDWCAPCIRLEREIWESEVFKNHAVENYVLYKADFPRKKKNQLPPEVSGVNKKLAAEYNPNGYFPLVLLLDQEANVLGTTGYKGIKPKKYIELLDAFLQ